MNWKTKKIKKSKSPINAMKYGFLIFFLHLYNNVCSQSPFQLARLERAHGVAAFRSKKVVCFDFDYELEGKTRLRARVYARTNSSAIRLERADGVALIFDGRNVCQTPDSTVFENARFNLFSWHYFFAFPFKVRDMGTKWQFWNQKLLLNDNITYETARLTFEKNISDSSEDHFIAFQSENGQLAGLAYHVSAFETKEKTATRAITYHDYINVAGCQVAQTWIFWKYDAQRGAHTRAGSVRLSNIKFVEETATLFRKPKSCLKI